MSYLVSHHPRDAKLQTVVDSLPTFAGKLYGDARRAARKLLRSHTPNPLTRIARGIAAVVSGASAKETALANCIFDLQLTVFFSEFSKYFGENDVALRLEELTLVIRRLARGRDLAPEYGQL